jgi:carbon-monoxide dehydrogenase large subunit
MNSVGSRSLQTAGSALSRAADEILIKGKQAAAQILQAGGAEVGFEIEDGIGMFRVSGTARAISVQDLAKSLRREKLSGFESGLDASATYEGPPTFPNGCHICEVEIDPETGTVAVVRYTIVDDLGRIINPLIVRGQVHGGVAQGLGQALMENVVYDSQSGQMLTATLLDYALPRAADMPKLNFSYNEIPCTTNPLGSKGAGEAGTIGALPALMSAIADALGVMHIDMPATPEKIWRAARTAG